MPDNGIEHVYQINGLGVDNETFVFSIKLCKQHKINYAINTYFCYSGDKYFPDGYVLSQLQADQNKIVSVNLIEDDDLNGKG